MKKVLAILGSPFRHGTIARMLETALQEAEKNGWETETITLYEKKLAYCKGCFVCDRTGECIQKDDIQEIAEKLKACDVVILAAPVYWANVPGIVKNMFDRLRGTVMKETDTFPLARLPKGKKYIFLTACNTPSPFSWIFGQTRGAVHMVKEFFKTAGVKCAGNFACTNAYKKEKLPASFRRRMEKLWRRM